MLILARTYNKNNAPRSFRRRRVTKVKWEFLRWIFVKARNVKIHWENVYFLRMSENEKKRVRRRVVLQSKDFLRTDIIYKVLLQPAYRMLRLRGLFLFWNSFVGLHPPPRFPAHKFRTLKSLSPPTSWELLSLFLVTSGDNSNPTSGHLKVEILIRPLDTSKWQF